MDLLAFEITFVAEEQLSLKMGLQPFCLSLDWLDGVHEVDKRLCHYLRKKTMRRFKEILRLKYAVLALCTVYLKGHRMQIML